MNAARSVFDYRDAAPAAAPAQRSPRVVPVDPPPPTPPPAPPPAPQAEAENRKRGRPPGSAATHPSITKRLEQWARDNPDDDLTIEDAAVKFNTTVKSMRARLHEMEKDGTCIEYVRVIRLRRGGGSK